MSQKLIFIVLAFCAVSASARDGKLNLSSLVFYDFYEGPQSHWPERLTLAPGPAIKNGADFLSGNWHVRWACSGRRLHLPEAIGANLASLKDPIELVLTFNGSTLEQTRWKRAGQTAGSKPFRITAEMGNIKLDPVAGTVSIPVGRPFDSVLVLRNLKVLETGEDVLLGTDTHWPVIDRCRSGETSQAILIKAPTS